MLSNKRHSLTDNESQQDNFSSVLPLQGITELQEPDSDDDHYALIDEDELSVSELTETNEDLKKRLKSQILIFEQYIKVAKLQG